MAAIIPIRGVRYNPRIISDPAQVVTPPYDVIDAAAQADYYGRSPYNVIRLEYGKINATDNDADNRYTRARDTFQEWLDKGVLIQDQQPALYLYEQEYSWRGKTYVRRGFFCGVHLEPYTEGRILPHEETIPKHKADRLELMRHCRANFSPVFGLYPDEPMVSTILLKRAMQAAPDISLTDDQGQKHRVWVTTDHQLLNRLIALLEEKRIFIADGHHRYETALAYANEVNRAGLPNYALMVLVNLYDPGLVVLPTHRLVRSPGGLHPDLLVERLQELFTVEAVRVTPDRLASHLQGLEGRGKGCFALYAGSGRHYVVTLKPEANVDQLMSAEKSAAWRGLDVSILHNLILEKHLGIGSAERTDDGLIQYTREETGALEAVDRGEFDYVFFMNPTGVDELVAVAEAGDLMPQKSTYFYPKLSTGLVINKL